MTFKCDPNVRAGEPHPIPVASTIFQGSGGLNPWVSKCRNFRTYFLFILIKEENAIKQHNVKLEKPI